MAAPVAKRGEGRQRVLQAALELFAAHGVSGTSLHMIADALGVTKAAVYYQFKSKDELVLAVLEPAVQQLTALVETAEAAPPDERFDRALAGLVDLAVDQGRTAAVMQGDPATASLTETHEPLRSAVERLRALLEGSRPDITTRVTLSVVGQGLLMARTDPVLADVDDATLRREMLACARAATSGLTRG